MDISPTQHTRVQKIERLREYFQTECPEVYEWSTGDENLDFALMTEVEIEAYLGRSK